MLNFSEILPDFIMKKKSVKIGNRNARKRCEICSVLTTKTSERRRWRRSHVLIVNSEHNSHVFIDNVEYAFVCCYWHIFANRQNMLSEHNLPVSIDNFEYAFVCCYWHIFTNRKNIRHLSIIHPFLLTTLSMHLFAVIDTYLRIGKT